MPRVIIKSSGYIPFIQGNGPILKPITISDSQYVTLIKMGFDVKIIGAEGQTVKTPVSMVETAFTEVRNPPSTVSEPEVPAVLESTVEVEETTTEEDEVAEVSTEEVVEEEVVEEEVVEEEVVEEEVVEEEVVEEEVVEEEEILVDDEDLSAEAFYNEDFLTKAKAKTILEKRGVDFEASANATELKQLVLDSNPEVSE